jgi:HlyD family secretion protein
MKGVVIARRVNVGHTVVDSRHRGGALPPRSMPNLAVTSLFDIADDVEHMQIQLAVSEDIGAKIRKETEVIVYAADAPNEQIGLGDLSQFQTAIKVKGILQMVGLNGPETPRGAEYTVMIDVPNPNGRIRPNTRAVVKFVESYHDALLVSGQAFKWSPRPELLTAEATAALNEIQQNAKYPPFWVKTADGQHVQPVAVESCRETEEGYAVTGPNVKEGLEAVIADEPAKEPQAKPLPLRTTKITRGNITTTLNATGTVEPEELRNVNAQVAGQIVSFGDDPRAASDPNYKDKTIDYLSPVDEGTILAKIDDTPYKNRVEQQTAAVKRATAELILAESKVQDKKNDAAARSIAIASLTAAKAALAETEAALKQAKDDLSRTVIRSPIKGVVIDRRVNVGQNVTNAGPNVSSLFLIAKDIKKMQVWASVREADIAKIQKGAEVRFTVDAFPQKTYKGTVSQIRMNATMTQNVVTYTVVIAFDNPDLKVLPYMTAKVVFPIENRNVLCVPNAALKWQPRPEQLALPVSRMYLERSEHGGLLWVKDQDGQHVQPLTQMAPVGSDGTSTIVVGNDVKEGLEVVLGEEPATP